MAITLSAILLLLLVSSRATSTPLKLSYAALGDSYASGDGAGSSKLLPNLDPTCGRFDAAYPVQLVNNSKLEITSFRNIACGGASTTSVLRSQSWWIGNRDVVSLTVGGNEVDFFVLLNECVQQWHPFSTCESEMAKSKALIESSSFIDNYDQMLRGLRKTAPYSRLLVTGYASFFAEDTDQCSTISFSVTNRTNFLTKTLRREFNTLVRSLNDVIRAACYNHAAEYIDMDKIFAGHRFCEPGVTEPSSGADTWFYNIEYEQDTKKGSLDARSSQKMMTGPFGEFFNLTRTFHPTPFGHQAIAQALLKQIKT